MTLPGSDTGRRVTAGYHELRRQVASRLHSWPLRWRLITVLVALIGIALTLTSLVTTARMRAYLIDRTNAELRVAAEPLAARVNDQYKASRTTVGGVPSNYVIVLLDGQGGPEVATSSFDARYQPAIPRLSRADLREFGGEPFSVGSVNGDVRWQALAGMLDDGRSYVVASSLYSAEQTINQLQFVATVIGVTVTGACVLLGWFAIRRAFRPLRTIEDTAAGIAAGDLTRRVPMHQADDEVASLSRSLNAMLSQIESAFAVRKASEERMRRFVADASHELRTPLATVRGYAELFRQGAVSTPEATASAMGRIEGEAARMSALVEDLLLLVRMDDRGPATITPVDMTVVAGDAVQDARARDQARPLRMVGLEDRPIRPAVVNGVEPQLRQVVTNLLANALQHTPPGTPVEVAVGIKEPGTIRLEVRDHGAGIPVDDVPRVFERFYRADPARGRRQGGGTGLGLAIVHAIVTAHRGAVGVRPTPGGGATFTVDLPVHADASRQPPADVQIGHTLV